MSAASSTSAAPGRDEFDGRGRDRYSSRFGQRVRQGECGLALFKQALAELERHRPVLLVDLGDRINQPELAGARAAMTEVAAGFHRVSSPKAHLHGNNDVTPRSEQETMFGVPLGNRCLVVQGWQLIFLDTFDGSVGGSLAPETLAWLERTLAANDLPALVFNHQPIDGRPLLGNAFFGGSYGHQAHPRGHEAARRMMERSGKVKLAVSGHAHWNHSVTVSGIRYLTLAALVPFSRGDDRGGFYGLLTLDSAPHLEVCRCGAGERNFQRVVNPGKNGA